MKHQHYIVTALMLLAGTAWGDGYRGSHGYSPYGAYVNPHNPNTPRFYGHQGHYGNQYVPGNPYTPYNSPNPYKFNGNPYAADSIDTPYSDSPYRARNPYRTYGSPYYPNPAAYPHAIDAQQLYHSHGYYQGIPSPPNSVPPLYEPYGTPYSPDALTPYGNGNTYDPGSNHSNPFE